MDDIKKMGPKALKGLAVEALTGALTGGVASAFNALKSIFGGAKLVFQFLGKPLEKFVGQIKNPEAEAKEAEKGEDDPTVKEGRYLKFTSTQVRFLTEASELEEAKNTCWDGYSPGAKSGKKTKKGKGGKRVPNCELQEDDESDSTIKYNGNKALKGDQTKLPDKLQKGIIDKRLEEDDTPHEKQYDAPQGSKRDKQLDQTKADLKSGDPERVERAYRRRERMERSEREKNESTIRALIEEFMKEALSKKTKATLRKKAEERGLTVGSVEKEYKKGLAAWATSGSRKGMGQHQWAMARVNSATPSKDWASVKKSKAKKKK